MAKGKSTSSDRETEGWPSKIPFDFGQRIMENLRRHIDSKTGLVKSLTASKAQQLGGSRSAVSRELRGLRQCGAYELVYVRIGHKKLDIYYRLKGWAPQPKVEGEENAKFG